MVDANELSHFKKMSSQWWDNTSGTKGLHSMNELRVPLVRDGLIKTGAVRKELIDDPKPLKDMVILEVGCGGGIFTEALAKLGCTITGIDLCPDLIEQARQHAALDPSLSNLNYSLESVEEHGNNNYEKYDAIVASEVLEHVPEPKMFLEACVKCLKPGGIIFAEYIWGIVDRGTHHWNKFIAPSKTRKILECCGILAEALAELGCTIKGIDVCPDLIEKAKQHAALNPFLSNYSLESVEEHGINNYGKYDAIVASEVLEHVPERKMFLEACVKCLKSGGPICITTEILILSVAVVALTMAYPDNIMPMPGEKGQLFSVAHPHLQAGEGEGLRTAESANPAYHYYYSGYRPYYNTYSYDTYGRKPYYGNYWY